MDLVHGVDEGGGQSPAAGVTGDEQPVRIGAAGQQPLQHQHGVLQAGRERELRGQPDVGDEDLAPGLPAQPGDEHRVHAGRGPDVPPAVEVEHGSPGRGTARPVPDAGYPGHVPARWSTSSDRTTGVSTAPDRSSRTSSTERNSSMGSEVRYPMNERMVSRVTATARLCGTFPSPVHGFRNGTRPRDTVSWPAKPTRSVAAMGHVERATPGRRPITIGRTSSSSSTVAPFVAIQDPSSDRPLLRPLVPVGPPLGAIRNQPTGDHDRARRGSDRLGGQTGSEPEQLVGGATQGQLDVLGHEEVAVQRVVAVHAHPAVQVDGGVNHPLAPVGGPELGHGHLAGRPADPRRSARRPARR